MAAQKTRLHQIHAAMMRKFAVDAYANGGGMVGLEYAIGRYVDEAGYQNAVPAFIALSGRLDTIDAEKPADGEGAIIVNVTPGKLDHNKIAALEAMLPSGARHERG